MGTGDGRSVTLDRGNMCMYTSRLDSRMIVAVRNEHEVTPA